MTETWTKIAGYENYEASDQGRVRSVPHVDRRGHRCKGQILKAMGKPCQVQPLIRGRMVTRTVGSLILRAFVGPPPHGHLARHLDADYWNNRLENLAWGSYKQHLEDSIRNGKRDPDWIAKLRQLACGHEVSPEVRQKLSKFNKGRKPTLAARRKMSEAHKRRWAARRGNP